MTYFSLLCGRPEVLQGCAFRVQGDSRWFVNAPALRAGSGEGYGGN